MKTGTKGPRFTFVNGVWMETAALVTRDGDEARGVCERAHQYRICAAMCRHTERLQVVYLDHNRANNAADNLAWLCANHHEDYIDRLIDPAALKLQRDHSQKRNGLRGTTQLPPPEIRLAAARRTHETGKRIGDRSESMRRAGATIPAATFAAAGDSGIRSVTR